MIFIRVNGDAKEAMKIEDFNASKDGAKGWLFDSVPVNFNIRMKNDGSVHEQPVGQIIVKDIFGNVAVAVNMNLEGRNVLPGTIRKFEAIMDKTGVGDRMLFGPHTATVTMKYGSNGQTTTASTTFWIFPWKLILTIIVVLIILVLVGRLLIKRYNDRLLGSRGGRSRRR